MKRWFIAGLAAAVLAATAGETFSQEFRLGGNVSYLIPTPKEFSSEFGYGARLKYKFHDTLGFEIGADFFEWSVEELIVMPYEIAPGPVWYKEKDRVFPLHFSVLIFSPEVTQEGRPYLAVGTGYYFVRADIEGRYRARVDGREYDFDITGDVSGGPGFHVGAGIDFWLGENIFLNVDARWVYTRIKREQTHFNPELGSVTEKDRPLFNNWQLRAGLEYKF